MNLINRLWSVVAPVFGMIAFVILLILGLFIFSYFLIVGAIIGLILFIVAFIRLKLASRKHPTPSAQQGRIIEHEPPPKERIPKDNP